ncbi:multiple sugar transport system substrate-binding protein [Microbacterium sp. SLBN-154]|uniref:ABC transporter substrate-binding protein n=1 Tax=Microbacterium sp. SLBN-154 TaxID=2768458 RepID=UPI001169F33E|nr:extracellular solute-binding protein [Microbacterium sp. SLBN-154]TQK17725.1 multiple sugar transport system substrate-binding protein [Microbacterium sp. SLBN-154]
MTRITRVATVVVAALLVTGCSSQAADPNETPSLTIWVDAPREAAAQAYADSVEGDVDVTVEVRDTNNLVADIGLANRAQEGWPDVAFSGQPNSIAQLSDPDNGFAAPVNDLVPADFLDAFGSANVICEADGSTYCLRNDLAQTVLWYDVPTFEELGLEVPATFEEFAEVAQTLQQNGYVAGAVGDNAGYTGFFESSGCTFTDLDGNVLPVNPDAPECQRVVELIDPLLDSGALDRRSPFDAGFVADVAQQGKVAMQIGPSWFGDFVYTPEDSWGVEPGRTGAAAMPIWDGAEEPYSGQWGGGYWVISSHSEYPDAAADAVEWILSDAATVEAGPTYPAYGPSAEIWGAKTAANDFYAFDIMPVLTAQAAVLNPATKSVLFDIDAAYKAELAAPITAGESAADALQGFAQEVRNLAEEAGYDVND